MIGASLLCKSSGPKPTAAERRKLKTSNLGLVHGRGPNLSLHDLSGGNQCRIKIKKRTMHAPDAGLLITKHTPENRLQFGKANTQSACESTTPNTDITIQTRLQRKTRDIVSCTLRYLRLKMPNDVQPLPKQVVPILLHNGLHYATNMETDVYAATRN